jgi:ABC-2 type transport system ATP-binding protein
MIEVDNIVKTYRAIRAVSGVSFHVGRGEIVGLLGPNGAGKTTIMKILTCYHFPDAGTARLGDHDVFDEPEAIKSIVGYLPETAPLYSDLKVREYLEFIGDARGMTKQDVSLRIDWVIEKCGLAEVIDRNIAQISKGFRQRTGLAGAILHDPAILILDEPTGGLDPNQIIEIRSLIRELGKEKTVIISTHILQEVEAVCGRVLILSRGRLAAQGTTDEIGSEIKGENVYKLLLKGNHVDAASEELRTLPSLRRIIDITKTGREMVRIRCTLETDGRGGEQLFDWAVAKQYKILELIPESLSLEDIFIRLTAESGEGNG